MVITRSFRRAAQLFKIQYPQLEDIVSKRILGAKAEKWQLCMSTWVKEGKDSTSSLSRDFHVAPEENSGAMVLCGKLLHPLGLSNDLWPPAFPPAILSAHKCPSSSSPKTNSCAISFGNSRPPLYSGRRNLWPIWYLFWPLLHIIVWKLTVNSIYPTPGLRAAPSLSVSV